MITRRDFIGTLGLGLLAAPLVGEAQETKVVRLGILAGASPRSASIYQAFEQRLRELGFVDGQNLTIEFRNPEGKFDRFPTLAAELVQLHVDLIVVGGQEAALQAVRRATATIPIVLVAIDFDPIASGYIGSLARPSGNITGVFFRQLELTLKRLELLKAAVPSARRVAILWDAFGADQLKAAESAAEHLGLRFQSVELRNPPYDFADAFNVMKRGRADALFTVTTPLIFRERGRIADLALKHRLPAIFAFREHADVGGLMAYGANISDMFRTAATYAAKILKGAKPADLPVEQPTKFELVINLKTAKALGLTIPQPVLGRADEVIQ